MNSVVEVVTSHKGQDVQRTSGKLTLYLKKMLQIDGKPLSGGGKLLKLTETTAEAQLRDGSVELYFGDGVVCRLKAKDETKVMGLLELCRGKFEKKKSGASGGIVVAQTVASESSSITLDTRSKRHHDDEFELGTTRDDFKSASHIAKRRSIDNKVETGSPAKYGFARGTMQRAPPRQSTLLQRSSSFQPPQNSSVYRGYRSTHAFGLQNLGNTCYLNAVTQAIASLREFVTDLRDMPKQLPGCERGELFNRTLNLLAQLKESGALDGPVSPARLREQIALSAPMFRGSGQQDAHEFFLEYINQMHDELLMTHSGSESQIEDALATQLNFDSEVHKVLSCIQCDQTRTVTERFRDFSLDFTAGASREASLQGMLSSYFQRECVEAKCEHCNAVAAHMDKCLAEAPRVLVLHLKRFIPNLEKQCYEKQHQSVKFPLLLDLSAVLAGTGSNSASPSRLPARPLAADSSSGKEDDCELVEPVATVNDRLCYSLRAVITHEGSSPRSGHYVCYAQGESGTWRLYDDSRVKELSKDESPERHLGSKAYILFYVLNGSGLKK
eukprot:TRINITY_DN20500_c0_g1_i1.p1 TRINITY_DN20500_c0_g1~~TRINITY_DN20500_c0_g1_i1.p1  ORF type:complete len:556 (-),score=85.80 TRINITY_DN20500_c0_g1_i1:342-2009(-)